MSILICPLCNSIHTQINISYKIDPLLYSRYMEWKYKTPSTENPDKPKQMLKICWECYLKNNNI